LRADGVLILSGVIGGVIGFGAIGLFIGPVSLAVTWTLLAAWVGEIDRAPDVVDSAGEQ
jgi:predicted PurR-regulated permease PerM